MGRAMFGLQDGTQTMIPISHVEVDEATQELVLSVLRSGRLAQGPVVEQFEVACREMTGARHAVAVSNGTTALELALEAVGIGPGDEVVTTPFTFAATLNAIIHSGATATFSDIADDFTIDPTGVEAALTERTRALMPVHLYGLPADMDALTPWARRRGLRVVEDAAQAHGALIGSRPVGTEDVATFSFYATKNISTGEGGVITTDDDGAAERLRILRNQGMRARYEYVVPGRNARMLDVVAALALGQFARRTAMQATRRCHAAFLGEALAGIDGLVLPAEPAGRTSAWHQYTVRVTSDARVDRDTLAAELTAAGVGTGVYYPRAVYDYDCYRSHPRVRITPCPRAERFATEVLSLPVHPALSPTDLERIVAAVRRVLA
jgi:dTDP-4-amino-4,6-dideoxygalactose transaminase